MAPPKRPWFRFYVEAIHDIKLRTRPSAQRWLWVALLGMAAASPERGRLIVAAGMPADEYVIADSASLTVKEVEAGLAYFQSVGMIHREECGTWVVTAFLERQFESDVSTERSTKGRSSNGDATAMQRPNDGESDVDETSMQRSQSVSVSDSGSSIEKESKFDRFYAAYPRHTAADAARKALVIALRKASIEDIVAGAERFRDDPNRDPAFTPHPSTWLNQGRWNDDPLPPRGVTREPVGNRNTDRIRRITEEIEGVTTLGVAVARLNGGAA